MGNRYVTLNCDYIVTTVTSCRTGTVPVNHQRRGSAMPKTSHQLLTVVEAAARTGRKVSTWRRDILLRRIPYVKLGRSVRIPVEVVDRLIRDGWREAVASGDVVSPIATSSPEGTAWRSEGGSHGSL